MGIISIPDVSPPFLLDHQEEGSFAAMEGNQEDAEAREHFFAEVAKRGSILGPIPLTKSTREMLQQLPSTIRETAFTQWWTVRDMLVTRVSYNTPKPEDSPHHPHRALHFEAQNEDHEWVDVR